MKIVVIFVFLIAGACGRKYSKEVNIEDFYATFDLEISDDFAKLFDFPKEKALDLKSTPECRNFGKYPRSNKTCPVPKGIDNIGDLVSGCKERICIQKSYYGSTKCRKIVRLYKFFPHAAVECKTKNQSCKFAKPHDDKELYPEPSNDGKPHLYPDPSKSKNFNSKPEKDDDAEEVSCKCFTIWCFRDIYTIYEENGKLYEGDVVIKTPCGCDCRMAYPGYDYYKRRK